MGIASFKELRSFSDWKLKSEKLLLEAVDFALQHVTGRTDEKAKEIEEALMAFSASLGRFKDAMGKAIDDDVKTDLECINGIFEANGREPVEVEKIVNGEINL